MKATSNHFRCDLCGRFSDLGVTESYNVGASGDVRVENTVCVRCLTNGLTLMMEGLLAVTQSKPDSE